MATAALSIEDQRTVDRLVHERRVQFAFRSSRLIAWASVLVAAIIASTWLFFRQYVQTLLVAGFTLIIAVGGGLFYWFQSQGKDTVAIRTLLQAILLGIVGIPLFVPSLLPCVTMGYTLIILLGYLLLEPRSSRWLSAGCVLAFAANATVPNLWQPQWFPPLPATTGWILNAVAGAFGLAGDALILRQIGEEQDGSFRQAQEAKLQLKNQADGEVEKRARLQTMVEKYGRFMERVATGDLTARLSLDADGQERRDPLVALGRRLNDTVASLQEMTMGIRDAANGLGSAAAEIQAATSQQSASATQQSTAVVQATATIDEIRTIAEQTAQRAQSVADFTQRTTKVAQAGQQAVTNTVEGMARVKGRVDAIAHEILALSEKAQSIGQIVSTVNEIAAQSNMLALNAAVEAARAGEAGKGFSVVAGEVRSLAEQSRAATEGVKEILSEIQSGVNTSVMATEEGMKQTELGSSLASEAGESIRKLGEAVTASTQSALQIVAAAGQQLTGMEQIALAVQSMDQATTQTLAGAQQAERAATDLNVLAGRLREMVEQYRL
jgi:methyl-accepting chemotaxis protein